MMIYPDKVTFGEHDIYGCFEIDKVEDIFFDNKNCSIISYKLIGNIFCPGKDSYAEQEDIL